MSTKALLMLLNQYGFSGGSIVIIALLVAGYAKLIHNHFKHIDQDIKELKKEVSKLREDIGYIKGVINRSFKSDC